MAKVFIINEPLKKNDATGEYEKFLPLESAADFGTVVKLTQDGNVGSPAAWMRLIRDGLEKGWEDGDYLVVVGDPMLLAYAASIVGEYIGERDADGLKSPTLRFLKWERRQSRYVPVTLREAVASSAEAG